MRKTIYIVLNNVLGWDVQHTELVDLDANLLALRTKPRTAGKRSLEFALSFESADAS